MRSLLGKAFGTALFGILALCLAWYGVWTSRMAQKDMEFVNSHASFGLFPEVWLLKGNLAYFMELDSVKAVDYFKKAVSSQPILMPAWVALTKAEFQQGHIAEAHAAVRAFAPMISQVSTWKWQEMLLANDLRDDEYLESCFNFILARLPARVQEACYLAVQYWGDWSAVVPHVREEAQTVFLKVLMQARETDAALALWKNMEYGSNPPDRQLQLSFIQFLLGNDRLTMAKEIWKTWRQDGLSWVFNGGFESQPINSAFGWHIARHPDVVAERTLVETPYSGTYCLHLHFNGAKNINYSHVYQVIPVEPDRGYRLQFARRSRGITTNEGVFVEVTGFRCKGLSARSDPVRGTTPWTKEQLEFSVPAECEAVQLQVRRKESLTFDSKIAGDYWLDDVGMEESGS